jgi:SAM-dependent methyltransferase
MFNRTFDASIIRYASAYENSLHFSPLFRDYAKAQARRLIETYGIRDRDVIELGCGTGEFLGLLASLGSNRGVGFEPRWAGECPRAHVPESVRIIPEAYSDKYANTPADLTCCRHVLEHIPDPAAFVNGLRSASAAGTNPVLFFECPDSGYMIRERAVWDVIYEHCGYFGRSSLERLFLRCGFKVLRAAEAFHGQYVTLEARAADDAANAGPGLSKARSEAMDFGREYGRAVAQWKAFLGELGRKGQRAAVWGAGSKGVCFLDAVRPSEGAICVTDVNPRKHGLHLAGTGMRVVPPSFLAEWSPQVILVMNGIYTSEIRASARTLGLDAGVLAVGHGAPASS